MHTRVLFGLLLVLAIAEPVDAQTRHGRIGRGARGRPSVPSVTPAQTGDVVFVHDQGSASANGTALQAAVNAAASVPGRVIKIDPGLTYNGVIILPPTPGPDYVTIRTSTDDALLPTGTNRMDPTYVALLPKIVATAPYEGAFANKKAGTGVDPATLTSMYWKLQYLEVTTTYGTGLNRGYGTLVKFGDQTSPGGGCNATAGKAPSWTLTGGDTFFCQDSRAYVPHHFILDHCYIHGDKAKGQRAGVALNSGQTEVTNNYIEDMKTVGQDSQGIGGVNGPGPWKVENNYIEGAGENLLVGGSNPPIIGLVPGENVTSPWGAGTQPLLYRRNYFRKQPQWISPIIPTPTAAAGVAGTSGTLSASTVYYRIVGSVTGAEDTTWVGLPSLATSGITVSNNGSVALTWTGVTVENRGAAVTEYRVFRSTDSSFGTSVFWTSTGSSAASYTDTGFTTNFCSAGCSFPTASVWQQKNIFELKAAWNVLADGNLLENTWPGSAPATVAGVGYSGDQRGPAFVLTVRNQDRLLNFCNDQVSNITITNNAVRHAGAFLNLLGIDDIRPSPCQVLDPLAPPIYGTFYSTAFRSHAVTVRNNLAYDIGDAVINGVHAGGSLVILIANYNDVTVDHNTFINIGGGSVFVLGPACANSANGCAVGFTYVSMTGIKWTNNLANHLDYGIIGDTAGLGSNAINAYFPGTTNTFARSVLAGGPSGSYPVGMQVCGTVADTCFPTVVDFLNQFSNAAANNYRIVLPSHGINLHYVNAGTDGLSLGADVDAINAAYGSVIV